jgi:hypothetical protein
VGLYYDLTLLSCDVSSQQGKKDGDFTYGLPWRLAETPAC